MLNFDVIVIIIVLFAIINGLIRGIYRQILSLLSILIPTVIIFFSGLFIINYLNQLPFFVNLMKSIYQVIKHILNINLDNFIKLFVLIISYLVIYGVVKLILTNFSLTIKKRLSKKVNLKSRYIGGGLGLINAYLVIIFVFMFIKPIVNIDYDQPLTHLLLQIYQPLHGFLGNLLFI